MSKDGFPGSKTRAQTLGILPKSFTQMEGYIKSLYLFSKGGVAVTGALKILAFSRREGWGGLPLPRFLWQDTPWQRPNIGSE